ncbi:MAG: Holliday junction resolvase RuvX [Bacteroidetes bacterium]|nr:Holliday junction resolvase RuvX [Bacteroidota bacterium]MBU2583729.1 Holliday junction resolvase RuvX [Bacteroidota bacterium]
MSSRILSIDYGEKRIGLSVSDPTNIFATTLETISNSNNSIMQILKIIDSYNVNTILVGYPLNMNGTMSRLCGVVDEFITELERQIQVEIIKRDERLTSYVAQSKIIEAVGSKKKRQDKSLVDKFSAATILQDYLDEQKKN